MWLIVRQRNVRDVIDAQLKKRLGREQGVGTPIPGRDCRFHASAVFPKNAEFGRRSAGVLQLRHSTKEQTTCCFVFALGAIAALTLASCQRSMPGADARRVDRGGQSLPSHQLHLRRHAPGRALMGERASVSVDGAAAVDLPVSAGVCTDS